MADADVVAQLAPTGVLRAGINLANILLVTGRTETGDPAGVSPDMARAVADRLGVPVRYMPFALPGEVADAASAGELDVALIANEAERAKTIAFSPAYAEIEATYLVPAGSPVTSPDEVDRPGARIAVAARSAYDLYLQRSLKNAGLVQAEGLPGAFRLFRDGDGEGDLDALAGLRPALLDNARELPGARVLDGRFTTVRQAIGVRPQHAEAAAFVADLVRELRADGTVQRLIDRHGVTGRLSVGTDG